jgi:mRNA-degrading endonuclease HigB of HigAB toxin-antitoxin module
MPGLWPLGKKEWFVVAMSGHFYLRLIVAINHNFQARKLKESSVKTTKEYQ